MKYLLSLFLIFLCFQAATAQTTGNRPKVGLTLSGGGAKGLAHIGILKAIDSAGLKIDYITGTSVGAIVGALYAVGYTGNQIEQIAYSIDWDQLFLNQVSMKTLSMEEKEQYSRFAIELPYVNDRISLQTGVLQSQELNMKFAELFFHVNKFDHFNQFKIPFQCMATDLATGNLVVLDSGNITRALNASMAIPSVFKAVTIGDKKLVDGGLVRNFPVKNVKQMGADIVIGSNVSVGLSSIDKITNPIDVILQMAFFKEATDFKEEIPLTDIYVYMPLQKYTMTSFGGSNAIIDEGLKTGRTFYPQFKKLADSIQALGYAEDVPATPVPETQIYISGYRVEGLRKTRSGFFTHLMDFSDHRWLTGAEINKSIRRAYGSRYYNTVTYYLENVYDDTANIVFKVEENASTYMKAGIYYNQFRGINVNLNVTSRDFILPNSRSMVSLSLGETIQSELQLLQYLGRTKNFALIPGFNSVLQDIKTYDNFNQVGAYKLSDYKAYLRFQNSGSNRFAIGIGTDIEKAVFKPTINSATEITGNYSSFKTYFYVKYNSLNQIFFPTRGVYVNTQLGLVYNQRPNIIRHQDGQPVTPSGLFFNNYYRLAFESNAYKRIGSYFTLFNEFQAGINFTREPNVLNDFLIGGITGNFRNQVRFAGLQEATISSPSVVSGQIGLRCNLGNNIYITGRANLLIKNFVTLNNATKNISALTGYALSFSYKTPIGPLEISAMYSDQSQKLQPYIVFGIPF